MGSNAGQTQTSASVLNCNRLGISLSTNHTTVGCADCSALQGVCPRADESRLDTCVRNTIPNFNNPEETQSPLMMRQLVLRLELIYQQSAMSYRHSALSQYNMNKCA